MAPELLPATGDALHGLDVTAGKMIIPGEGEQRTRVERGPTALIAARLNYWKMLAAVDTNIASIVHDDASGRAQLAISFESDPDDIARYGLQELYGVDVVRDIKAAQYFAAMSNDQVAAVQAQWDDRLPSISTWTDLQKKLYGHMAHGQESYVETAYEFRQTFQTTSQRKIQKATSNPNTVQSLPTLSPTMKNQIDAVPTGEWLKKPTTVNYAGRRGWTVALTFQWAPKWSVIYGGTFTGV